MKRNVFILICFLLCFLSPPLNADASVTNVNKYLTDGCTSEGIHYTIYDVQPSTGSTTMNLQRAATQLYVVRQIHFDGYIRPQNSWFFAEQINGHIYTGTLTLTSYKLTSNKTIATYEGYFNLVN